MTIIAIANQKGGCGKTTTAINLSACLGRRNQKILLVDMDPQGHASLGLGQHCEDIPGLYEVFMMEEQLDDVIVSDAAVNVDLVPATISLAAVEHLLSDAPHREKQLDLLLAPVKARYDYIIIDCPPQLGLLSFNALRAADELLIPVELSSFSLDGLERLSETVDLLSNKYQLAIPQRILATLVDYRTRFTRMALAELRSRYPEQTLSTVIHATIRIKEAAWKGKPVIEHAAQSPAAYDYEQLAEELLIETGKASWDTLPVMDMPEQDVPAAPKNEQAIILPAPADDGTPNDTRPVRDSADLHRVTLHFSGNDATSIRIAGEFNDWMPDQHVETRRINGIIQKVLTLKPGLYQYRLIIDGKWQADPGNPLQIVNDYGEVNSLLKVEEPAEEDVSDTTEQAGERLMDEAV